MTGSFQSVAIKTVSLKLKEILKILDNDGKK